MFRDENDDHRKKRKMDRSDPLKSRKPEQARATLPPRARPSNARATPRARPTRAPAPKLSPLLTPATHSRPLNRRPSRAQVMGGPGRGGKLAVGYQQALLASKSGGVSGLGGTKDKIAAFKARFRRRTPTHHPPTHAHRSVPTC